VEAASHNDLTTTTYARANVVVVREQLSRNLVHQALNAH
jgi:hypothetical protein